MISLSIRHNPALLLLLAAIAVAVAAMSAVALFVDRVERALQQQGASLLAADSVIEQPQPISAQLLSLAQQSGLQTALIARFPSVIFIGDSPQLVQIKAVDDAYPLRGTLTVQSPDATLVRQAPKAGMAYLDSRLAGNPALAADEKLPLGELQLTMAGVVLEEPDRGGSLFQIAPRLMMNLADLPKTGLVGPGSRVRYRLLLAGDLQVIQGFLQQVRDDLPANARILNINNARPELRAALERGQRFMGLAVVCASLLAGITLLLASRHYVSRAMDNVAVLRTLGMSGRQVMQLHLLDVFKVYLYGSLAGLAVGAAGQWLLAELAAGMFVERLPAAGWTPYFYGLVYGAVLLPGFVLPELMRLQKVSPMRVIRRELTPAQLPQWTIRLFAAMSFILLVYWQAGDLRLAAAVIALIVIIVLLAMLIGQLMLLGFAGMAKRQGVIALGISALIRNAALTRWQLSGFAMGIALLLVLAIVRIDLLDTWKMSLPADTPDHFLINIQPGEEQPIAQWFEREKLAGSGMKATARARLVEIDGIAIADYVVSGDRAQRLLQREYNLGFADQLPDDSRIIRGQSWSEVGPGFSVEQEMAEKLRIKVGSQLVFEIAGQRLAANVINTRSVAWDSFNVNFFVQANEEMMQDIPVSYLSSVYLSDKSAKLAKFLASDYPAVSMLDLRPVMQQVRNIMDKGSRAVEAVFLFTLLAAVLLTVGAVMVNRAEKSREIAVLRTLGASRRQLFAALMAEFGLLGLIAGLVAASMAALTGYSVAWYLFDLAPQFNPMLWFAGVGSGLLLLLLTGLTASYRLLGLPPMQVIQSNRLQ